MEQTFDRLSALDSFFLDSEHEQSPMHIGAVCLFEEPRPGDRRVSLERLRSHVQARLCEIPRYRQRIARVPVEGHPVWVDAEDFRIEDHVRAVALPSPASPGNLEETVSWIFSRPLSRNRPLWEIWLIEGLADGGFALACKTHHCLADGMGGVAVLCAILGLERFSISRAAPAWQPRPRPTATELLRSAVQERVRGVAEIASAAWNNALFAPQRIADGAAELSSAVQAMTAAAWHRPATTAFDDPAESDRRFLWWTIALDDVRRIGRRLGGTVNDVALAMISDAFAETSADARPDQSLRVYCPVAGDPVGLSTLTLGNRVAGMFVDLPVHSRSLDDRWNRVVGASRRCKASGSAEGAFLLERLANALSPTLLSRVESLLGGRQLFNLVLTNVPGPREPLFLFEHQMTGICPLVPLLRGQGLAVAIFSYNDSLTWGFHVDAGRVDAARRLRSALAASAIRLARLADKAVSARRTAAIPLHPEPAAAGGPGRGRIRATG